MWKYILLLVILLIVWSLFSKPSFLPNPISSPTSSILSNETPEPTLNRITKKSFGTFITPQNSPVQPERFSGYHTGLDFETFPDEQDRDIQVHAVCSGKLLTKRYASGYGGVVVQGCSIDNQDVTVIYGHLNSDSVVGKVGDFINSGEKIGTLGKGYSKETDRERKHLHLGIHKGNSITILGYVQNKNDLAGWIDPQKLLEEGKIQNPIQ